MRTMRDKPDLLKRLVCVGLLAIVVYGCSSSYDSIYGRAQALGRADESIPPSSVGGIWRGTSMSSRDGRILRIRVSLSQYGDRLTGFYSCATGNATCPNGHRKGTASGRSSVDGFRVDLPDGSWCLFHGRFGRRDANGSFRCYSAGALIDNGSWRMKRQPSYETAPGLNSVHSLSPKPEHGGI